MKTIFELESTNPTKLEVVPELTIKIIGRKPKESPYVAITTHENRYLFIQDKDLELFAVNILKALKSKKLK